MVVEPVGLSVAELREAEGPPLLVLEGELDLSTAPTLLSRGDRLLLEGHRDLVIDCANLTFCDSAGLRVLVTLSNAVVPDGSVRVVRPNRTVRRLLDITGLTRRFHADDPT